METRLVPINAMLGLLRGDGRWPRLLGNHGYLLYSIETPIAIPGDGNVVADLIAVNDTTRDVLLFEGKSSVVPETQTKRYLRIGPSHVARSPGLPFQAASVTVAWGCTEAHADIVRTKLRGFGARPLMVIVGEGRVTIEPSPLAPHIPGIASPTPGGPPRIVEFDQDSREVDLGDRLLVELLSRVARPHEEVIPIDSLMAGVVGPWMFFGHDARNVLCKKATRGLTAVIVAQHPTMFRVERHAGGACGLVRVLRSPSDYRPRGKVAGWRAIQARTANASGHALSSGPQQLTFSFEDLGLDAEIGET